MSDQQQPLVVGGWQNGIGQSPHVGIGNIRAADIESFPGAVKANLKPITLFHSINTVTFTADAGTDVCTASGTIEANGKNMNGAAVYFTTTGTLPAGLSTGTTYYLIQVTATTFKVATSYKNSAGSTAGTQIDITDAGTGTHTMNQLPIGTINVIIGHPDTTFKFMLGSNGRVWFSNGSTAYLLNNSAIDTPASGVTNANGKGMVLTSFSSTSALWLFVFRNALVDVIDVSSIETISWSNGWKNLNSATGSSNSHHAIVGQDDAVYFCDDRYVGSIIENVGSTFAPGTGSTFTYNSQALDLPTAEIANWLEELGADLLVAGDTYNKIYPWDRVSNSFNLPIICPEKGIKKIKNIGGLVYILSGRQGNIYTTQGSYVNFARRLPRYAIDPNYSNPIGPIQWGGIEEQFGSLIFGINGDGNSSGVWKLYPDSRLIHDNYPSTGIAKVESLYTETIGRYIMGYNGGADGFQSSVQYDNFETVLQSELFPVASKTKKGTFSKLEVRIANKGASGSLRVSYRTDKAESFTTLATFVDSDFASSLTAETDIGLTDIENIQIQIEMDDEYEFINAILYP